MLSQFGDVAKLGLERFVGHVESAVALDGDGRRWS
jgi:hypothetical protein